jgi:hypothetical protein
MDDDEVAKLCAHLDAFALPRAAKKEFLALPFAEDHHTSVKAINGGGMILGAASTDSWKHSHPLVWRLDLNLLSSR